MRIISSQMNSSDNAISANFSFVLKNQKLDIT